LAHGSDAGGSIRLPASACGVVGLKPSRGRVSNELPGWDMLLQEGPIARTVADAAAMLDAIQGYAPGDPFWAPPPTRPFVEEARTDPGRLRIGFLTDVPAREKADDIVYSHDNDPTDAESQAAVRAVAASLAGLGHDVAEEAPDWGGWDLGAVLMWGYTAPWLAMEEELPPFEVLDPIQQVSLEMIRKVSLKDYMRMMNDGVRRTRDIVSFWDNHDILVMPTVGAPTPRVDELREPDGKPSPKLRIGPFCFIWNVTGQPAISLPLATFSDGMPLGVQMVGAPGDEATLLRLAGQLEAAFPQSKRRPASYQM
jgi:amidase